MIRTRFWFLPNDSHENPHDTKLETHDLELEASYVHRFRVGILMETPDGAKLEAHHCRFHVAKFDSFAKQFPGKLLTIEISDSSWPFGLMHSMSSQTLKAPMGKKARSVSPTTQMDEERNAYKPHCAVTKVS